MRAAGGVISAIFFDIDDTLWDRTAVLDASLDAARSASRLSKQVSADEFRRRYEALAATYIPRRQIFDEIARRYGLTADSGVHMDEAYTQYQAGHMWPYAHAADVVARAARRLTTGIITNGPSESQREKIAILGLSRFIQHVVISSEVGVAKPNRRVFEHACAIAGAAPDQTAYVGNDVRLDIDGANEAGLVTVWANMHGGNAFGDTEPDYEIHAWAELPPIMEDWMSA